MTGVKVQKFDDGAGKVIDVFGLDFLAPLDVCFAFLCVSVGRPFRFQVGANLLDGFRWCPDAFRKGSSALLLLHQPMIAGRFEATSQRRVSGRTEFPVRGNIQNLSVRSPRRSIFGSRRANPYVHVWLFCLRNPLSDKVPSVEMLSIE